MPADPKAYERLAKHLRRVVMARRSIRPDIHPTKHRELTALIDRYLEEWSAYRNLATEWDAERWGFEDDWSWDLRKLINAKPMVKGYDGRWYPTDWFDRPATVLRQKLR